MVCWLIDEVHDEDTADKSEIVVDYNLIKTQTLTMISCFADLSTNVRDTDSLNYTLLKIFIIDTMSIQKGAY